MGQQKRDFLNQGERDQLNGVINGEAKNRPHEWGKYRLFEWSKKTGPVEWSN